MSRESTRDVLLEAGRAVLLERGYNHAGIESILHAAGVPKGSFYHYFNSKQDFGIQVLNRFAADISAELERHLGNAGLSPLERLRSYGESVCERLESRQCRSGCLVGNLSQEMADQSEAFRSRLEEIFNVWRDRLAVCLAEAQACGDLTSEVDAASLAELWICGWQGALMRAKTSRNTAPLKTFLRLMFAGLAGRSEPRHPEAAPER